MIVGIGPKLDMPERRLFQRADLVIPWYTDVDDAVGHVGTAATVALRGRRGRIVVAVGRVKHRNDVIGSLAWRDRRRRRRAISDSGRCSWRKTGIENFHKRFLRWRRFLHLRRGKRFPAAGERLTPGPALESLGCARWECRRLWLAATDEPRDTMHHRPGLRLTEPGAVHAMLATWEPVRPAA